MFSLFQILPDGGKTPQGKQLKTRANYLIRKIKKYLDGGAVGVSPFLKC